MNSADKLLDKLYAWRYGAIVFGFIVITFCNLYMWLFVPFVPYVFNWRPDHRLHVVSVLANSPATGVLQDGDTIIEIEGRPVHRANAYFAPLERQSMYTMLIERDGSRMLLTAPFLAGPDEYNIGVRLPAGVLSFMAWLVSALVLHLVWRENEQGIWLGYQFLLAAIAVISWNATLLGVPLVWLTSQPLLFLLGVGWVYAGFLPHQKQLSRAVRGALQLLCVGALAAGALAVVEGVWWFPRDTSAQAVLGVSLYKAAALAQAVGGLLVFLLLIGRRFLATAAYARRQLNILLVFVGVGFLPSVLLSFLPLAVVDRAILPLPLAMMALIFVPLGYAYVILRHGYLELDGAIGQTLPYLLLIVALTAVYGLALLTIDNLADDSFNLVIPAVLLFIVVAAFAPKGMLWFGAWVNSLVFGPQLSTYARLTAFTRALAYQPDSATLANILREASSLLRAPRAALLKYGDDQSVRLVACTGAGAKQLNITAVADVGIERPLVRAVLARQGIAHPVFAHCPWAGIAVPLRSREWTIGLLLLAEPQDGYFHARDIRFAEHVASTIAIGFEIIDLLNSAERLSQRIISVQEDEKRAFASHLHDRPLQKLAWVQMNLRQLLHETDPDRHATYSRLEALARRLKELDRELRAVYEGAFPTIIEYGIEATILKLGERLIDEHGLAVTFALRDIDAIEMAADDRVTQSVYHVLREASNNIVRHSHADRVTITTATDGAAFHLSITDDGVASRCIDLSETELLRRQHFGIVGMKAWTRMVGGTLVVERAGPGTRVVMTLPLAEHTPT